MLKSQIAAAGRVVEKETFTLQEKFIVEPASVSQQRSRSPLPTAQGGHLTTWQWVLLSFYRKRKTDQDPGEGTIPMPHTGLYLPPKLSELHCFLCIPALDTFFTPCDSYQPACAEAPLDAQGPWGFGQVLYCAACLEEEPT